MTDVGFVDSKGMVTAPASGCPELFVPERSMRVASIEEAQEACGRLFLYARAEIRLEQIFLEDDLGVTFLGSRYRLTEKALDDICAVINVPAAFAKAIPSDLAATIVQRLKALHQQTVLAIYRDDVLVAVVDPLKWTRSRAKQRRPHYEPVPAARLLEAIKKALLPPYETAGVMIADSGLSIEVLHPELKLEPRAGDITRIGIIVTGSETGGAMPQARGYTLRLVCTNGSTVPVTFGILRFETDWRVNLGRRLEAFEAGLRHFGIDLDLLQKAYERVASEQVTDLLLYSLYRQMRYLYRHVAGAERLADAALGIQADERRRIVAQVRRRQAGMADAWTAMEGPQPTGFYAFDVFNSITAAAREEPYRRRVALERLAGDLLRAYAAARGGAEGE